MISSNQSSKPKNALLQRIQRYSQASAIFRTTESAEGSLDGQVQSASVTPTKANFLPGPSTLPVGRMVDAQGIGNMPLDSTTTMSELASAALPSAPTSAVTDVSAAIDHVEQIQRSPSVPTSASEPYSPTIQPAQPPTPSSAPMSSVPVTPQPEADSGISDGDWSRLQRIIKGHEEKPETTNQPDPSPVQRKDSEETAVSSPPSSTIQRAIDTAESSTPAEPKKAPLESMWPVQKVEPPPPTSDEPIVMRQPDTPISSEPVQAPEEAETIRTKLGDVSSSRQTDSSIELHLPRRPRPAPLQAKPQKEDANKAFWDRLRKAEGKEPESVQRTVDTEIGALPADMWEILGEPVPDTASTPVTATPSSGDTPPTVQPKLDSADTPSVASSPSPTTDADETAVPSFLRETAAAPQVATQPPPSEAVQRAIAAAETPPIEAKEEPSTQTPVQRKEEQSSPAIETTTAVSDSPQTTVIPVETAKVETPSRETPSDSQTTPPPIQRKAEDSEALASNPSTTLPEKTKSVSTGASAPTSGESETTPSAKSATTVSESSVAIQQAIAAAETPPASSEKITPPLEEPAQAPTATDTPDQIIQAKRADSLPVDETPADPIQSASITAIDSSIGQTAVDLNAETAPLPELPDLTGTQTAVSPPIHKSKSAPADAVQRAIDAAEAPQAEIATDTPAPLIETAPSHPQIQKIQTKKVVDTPAQPSIEPATKQSEISQDSRQDTPPETIQRATDAVETTTAEKSTADKTAIISPTAISSPPPASATAIQRAIQAAETSPDTAQTETVPAPPETKQRTTDTAQESPSATEETAVSSPPTIAQSPPATADALQRAIQAAETPPTKTEPINAKQGTPPTVAPSPPTVAPSPPTAVSPPPTQTSQRTTQPEKTATNLSEPSRPTGSGEIIEGKTAVSLSPASPPLAQQAAIQRAIMAAETSPKVLPTPPTSQPHSLAGDSTETSMTTRNFPITSTPLTPTAGSSPQLGTKTIVQRSSKTANLIAPISREAQIQRAIATAEMPPSLSTATPPRQGTQTAVAQPPTHIQEMRTEDWQTAPIAPIEPTAPTALMRAIADAEKPAADPLAKPAQWPDIKPNTTAIAPNNIQRNEQIDDSIEAESIEFNEPDSIGEIDNSGKSAPEIDVDKLARQVYSQLRKRLATEWERGRGKR